MCEIIPFYLAKKLEDNGIIIPSLFAYNDEQVINPEIIAKYGYLSDDGYYELTKDGGGTLNFNEVYIYEKTVKLKRDIHVERNTLNAPLLSQVFKYFIDEIDIHVKFDVYWFNDIRYWGFEVIGLDSCMTSYVKRNAFNSKRYKSYNEAAFDSIDFIINYFYTQNKNIKYYIRIGEIPENETSKIYNGETIIEREGVSVYDCIEKNGKYHIVMPLPFVIGQGDTYEKLIQEVTQCRYEIERPRKVYLVTGKQVGNGYDNEPLIKNVKIIKDITKDFKPKHESN